MELAVLLSCSQEPAICPCHEPDKFNRSFPILVVSMLASGTQDREFEPGRSLWIFRAKKSTACLPWEGKIPAIYVEVGIAGQIDRPFLAQFRPSLTEVSHVA
jgi:hypothetical protein